MYNCVGIERRQYVNKQGRNVSGYNLYFTYEKKGTDGLACFQEWGSEAVVQESGIAVGDAVEILYNRYGKVESFRIV
jgi:hypothetical protein